MISEVAVGASSGNQFHHFNLKRPLVLGAIESEVALAITGISLVFI